MPLCAAASAPTKVAPPLGPRPSRTPPCASPCAAARAAAAAPAVAHPRSGRHREPSAVTAASARQALVEDAERHDATPAVSYAEFLRSKLRRDASILPTLRSLAAASASKSKAAAKSLADHDPSGPRTLPPRTSWWPTRTPSPSPPASTTSSLPPRAASSPAGASPSQCPRALPPTRSTSRISAASCHCDNNTALLRPPPFTGLPFLAGVPGRQELLSPSHGAAFPFLFAPPVWEL